MSLRRCEEAWPRMGFSPPSIQPAYAWQGGLIARVLLLLLLLVRLWIWSISPSVFRVRDLGARAGGVVLVAVLFVLFCFVGLSVSGFFTHCSLNILTPVVASTAFATTVTAKSRASLPHLLYQ